MFIAFSQDSMQVLEMVPISFHSNGAQRYVIKPCGGVLSDLLIIWLFQWFRLIVENRPTYNEDVTDLSDINDIRNGMFINTIIHAKFDKRVVVFLKVSHLSSNNLFFL
jgi:hypothetical protein